LTNARDFTSGSRGSGILLLSQGLLPKKKEYDGFKNSFLSHGSLGKFFFVFFLRKDASCLMIKNEELHTLYFKDK
jgi:hypothetical protein